MWAISLQGDLMVGEKPLDAPSPSTGEGGGGGGGPYRAREGTDERAPPRSRFVTLLHETRVYAVTDDALEPDRLIETVEALMRGGIRLFQFRDKARTDGDRVEIARTLLERVRAHDGLLIVNDRVDIALAAGVDGAHLGQDDLPLAVGRAMLGPNLVLGVSASYLPEIVPAISGGADYLGFGAVFPTDTKPNAEYAGLEVLEQACKLATVPVVGIGGIDVERAPTVLGKGAAGVAMVSALFRAADPERVSRRLLALLGGKSPFA